MRNLTVKKIRRAGKLLLELLKYKSISLLAVFCRCFNKKYQHIWLISERGREARDNGYHFFKYLSQYHPEINAYYVADPQLPDYIRVEKLGKVVKYRSFKHYLMCAVAEAKISTHISGYTPDIEKYYMLDKINVVKGKKIFLQHGIMIDDMKWYHYPNVKMDLFVCTLQRERDFVEKTFEYPEGIVKKLGLCRYDALLKPHTTKRQLLFMPTWRTYAVEGKTEEEFCKTDYYKHWQAVISNFELQKILEMYDYQAIFYPHFEVQRFLKKFYTECKNIKIATLGYADVQTLLMESQIMVTDFSSVQFDFAYMQKPEIYYQFDEKQYWGTHHDKGYFDYREDGFGPVVTESSALLIEIEHLLLNNGRLEQKYRERINKMFDHLDEHNCERNYQAIKGILR